MISMIPKGQTEIVKSEERQDHGQQNETKCNHSTHNTTLKTKGRETRNQQIRLIHIIQLLR